MGFSSLTFIYMMLITVTLMYCLIRKVSKVTNQSKLSNLLLLIISVIFYSWGSITDLYKILSIILFNYVFARLMSKNKKLWLAIGVLFNIGILFIYKYTSVFINLYTVVANKELSNITQLIAPLGISFIIFHCISFLVDLYRSDNKQKVGFLDFCLYILLFTKVAQGPIVPYKDFSPQLSNRTLSLDNLYVGLQRFVIGLGKKVIVADTLGVTVNQIFTQYRVGIDAPTAWIGMILFSIQLYMDFSGYSDMAIGLSRVFGFNIAENFNFPYISKSITEFWRRWHISLGSWFREYLYIPLGGNRKGNVYINLFIVFLATGMWHGSTLGYLFWGLMHGIVIVFERVLKKKNLLEKIPSPIRWFYTIFIVCIGWIIFKVEGLIEFTNYLKVMFGLRVSSEIGFTWQYFINNKIILIVVLFILLTFVLSRPKISEKLTVLNQSSKSYNIAKNIGLGLILILCLILIVSNSYSPFLYYQY